MKPEYQERINALITKMQDSIARGQPYWIQVPGKGAYSIGFRELGLADICILFDGRVPGYTLNRILDAWRVDPKLGVHELPEDDDWHTFYFSVRKIQTPEPSQHFAFNRDVCPNPEFVQVFLQSEKNGCLPFEPGYAFDPEAPDWLFDDNVTWFYSDIKPVRPVK
jgi:hypothetical protein